MPYKNKEDRNYKNEWKTEQARDEKSARAARARTRRAYVKANGPVPEGKVIDHVTPLSKGGSASLKNARVVKREENASFHRNSDGSVKRNTPKKK